MRRLFFLLALIHFGILCLVQAQYDTDGDGLDELIGFGVDSGTEALLWSRSNLVTGESTILASTLGDASDFPLFGVWQLDEPPSPAVVRKSDGRYDLIADNRVVSAVALPRNLEYLLTGDVDGDTLTDLVAVAPRRRDLVWTIHERPFGQNRARYRFSFGPSSGSPFIFQWRARYASFAVVRNA